MARVTMRAVNAAIKAAGFDAELVKGNGYFYFAGPALDGARRTSVMTYHLGAYSVAEWVDELRAIVAGQ